MYLTNAYDITLLPYLSGASQSDYVKMIDNLTQFVCFLNGSLFLLACLTFFVKFFLKSVVFNFSNPLMHSSYLAINLQQLFFLYVMMDVNLNPILIRVFNEYQVFAYLQYLRFI